MKAIILAAAIILSSSIACAGQADIDAMDNANAWKIVNLENGKAEIVFDPVTVRDWDTRTEWISAVSCDLQDKECYSFDFNPKQVKMIKIPASIAKAWKEGKLKAF